MSAAEADGGVAGLPHGRRPWYVGGQAKPAVTAKGAGAAARVCDCCGALRLKPMTRDLRAGNRRWRQRSRRCAWAMILREAGCFCKALHPVPRGGDRARPDAGLRKIDGHCRAARGRAAAVQALRGAGDRANTRQLGGVQPVRVFAADGVGRFRRGAGEGEPGSLGFCVCYRRCTAGRLSAGGSAWA